MPVFIADILFGGMLGVTTALWLNLYRRSKVVKP